MTLVVPLGGSGTLQRSWLIGLTLIAAAACAPHASLSPQRVDLAPILEVELRSTYELREELGDFDAIALGGVQVDSGRVRKDGVVDLFTKVYRSDPSQEPSFTVEASISRLASAPEAAGEFDSAYSFYARRYPFDCGAADGFDQRRYCISSVVQLRNDPEGLFLPSETYISFVFIQLEDLFISLNENAKGTFEIHKDPIIADLAERLSRPHR